MPAFDNSPAQAESFFKELADFAPVMIWRSGTNTACDWFNKPWLDFVGRSMEQEVGEGWTQNVHPHDFARCLDVYLSSFEKQRPFSMYYRLKRFDGQYRELLDNGAPFYREGAFAGYFGSCTDVTDLRAMEAQIHQTQKMEAIGQLTGGVAHDFNNLLTVIIGSVDILKRSNLSDVRRDRYFDAIDVTARRAAALTAQLLSFSRRQDLTPETFDVADSIDKAMGIVRLMAGSSIKMEVTSPDSPIWVTADRSQFDTALLNIAINARDAMNGEGKLVISSGTASVIPAQREDQAIVGNFTTVTISDNGCGIAKENLRRVFEPFFTTKEAGHGTGLGLSQVIGFVKQSGGDITVESVLDEGSTFKIYLPRVENAAPFLNNIEEPVSCMEPNGISVLIVEDNAEVAVFAAGALHELGYKTDFAKDGRQALDMLSRYPDKFQVVFSDVVMPNINGFELGRLINNHHPHIPIVLTSGYSYVLVQNDQCEFDMLPKPYSIAQLSQALLKAVRSTKSVVCS